MATKAKKLFNCKVYREGRFYKGSSEFRERLGYNGLDFQDKEIVDSFIDEKKELGHEWYSSEKKNNDT